MRGPLGTDPRRGGTPREHVQRVAFSMVPPPWGAVRVSAAYVGRLPDRVDALDRRVTEPATGP